MLASFQDHTTQTAVLQALRDGLCEQPRRIRALSLPDGRRLWLKRVEDLSLRLRLQKGAGRRGFENDRAGLRLMGAAGLPVAPILAEGPDYLLTPDLGPTLWDLMKTRPTPEAERIAAFSAAGAALVKLHSAGFSHGRPKIRDICWDGKAARLIDLERFSPRRSAPRHFALDLVILVHSVYALGGSPAIAELDAALAAYRREAPEATFDAVARLVRWIGLVWRFLAPIAALRPRSRELAAVALTLAYFRAP